MKECQLCGKQIVKYHRKYKGKGYCSSCYAYLFKKKQCSQCKEDKRIYRYSEPPVCQKCELKDKPCIRCSKAQFSIGKITEEGPVCNSCSKYYRPKRLCSICKTPKHNVSRRLIYNELEPICERCFNKKHFVSCCKCKQRVPPFLFNFQKEAYCRPCATKPNKACKVCEISMPAGNHSNTCRDCHARIRIERTLKSQTKNLSPKALELYKKYSNWLLDRRGVVFASSQIIKDGEVFEFLNNWEKEDHDWPNYENYAKALNENKMRKHLLASNFLDECRILKVDEKTKNKVGNLNTINRLIKRIPFESNLALFIERYHKHMLARYNQGKTSAIAFRLAMTPAVAMIELGISQGKTTPDTELINQYLWLHYGQRAAITGFINFLKTHMEIPINFPKNNDLRLHRPIESKARRKQKLISMLRSTEKDQMNYVKSAVEYFHNIQFPKELSKIKTLHFSNNNGLYKVKLAGQAFYVPAIASFN